MQKQDELIQSFNLALKSAKLARWEYNIETKEILITRSDTTQLYLKKDEIYNYILPTDKKVFDEYIVNVILLKKEESIILRLRRIDGTQYATCEMSSLVKYDSDFNPVAIYGIIKDLSDIKLVQQKVFELQYNMQLALDAGELSIWQYDKLNNEYINLYGNPLNGGRMTQKECLQYIHPDDSQIISDGIQNILNKKTDKITVQHRMDILSPGQWRWYACSMIAMPSDDDIRYIIGTRRDITQEIEYKKKLEEMNQKLELSYQQIDETLKYLTTILDKLPIPIYIKDPLEQKHIYINEEACKLYFTETNSTVSDLIIPENAEQCELIDKQITESGEDYSAYEVINFKNGRIMNTYVKKALITYNNKKLILAVRTDLTHQHKSLINKKMISNSVPLLKAYTWSYTSKDNVINFGETFVHNQRNIYDINTVEKFISIIHPEDQKTCKSIIQEYLKKGNGEYAFSYRMDLYQKGVYEWWQSKSVVETIHDINGSYILVYGVEVNINDKMNNLINN